MANDTNKPLTLALTHRQHYFVARQRTSADGVKRKAGLRNTRCDGDQLMDGHRRKNARLGAVCEVRIVSPATGVKGT